MASLDASHLSNTVPIGPRGQMSEFKKLTSLLLSGSIFISSPLGGSEGFRE